MNDTAPPLPVEIAHCSPEALQLVRYRFNPSGLPQVERIKLLSAALITELQRIQADTANLATAAKREAAVAITHVQTASMFGVAAATSGLPA